MIDNKEQRNETKTLVLEKGTSMKSKQLSTKVREFSKISQAKGIADIFSLESLYVDH